jgi:hypothetical protein
MTGWNAASTALCVARYSLDCSLKIRNMMSSLSEYLLHVLVESHKWLKKCGIRFLSVLRGLIWFCGMFQEMVFSESL